MKKVIFLLSMLLMSAMTYAQTIHWLTFIDTKDENVGEIDILGRKVLYGRYINLINAALASKGIPQTYKIIMTHAFLQKTARKPFKTCIVNLMTSLCSTI
ncbi:hypothetical protein [Barnesiella sp.]|uniref:hypothetical protein n=1 Tax=Barnesiella sp. TaxID=2033407 RepID=UPI00258A8538|nr:hypothetical protein [Barnesiella sp.]